MSKRYVLVENHTEGVIVDTNSGSVVLRLTLPRWGSTLRFELKVLNGELIPRWIDDQTLVWEPKQAPVPQVSKEEFIAEVQAGRF